MTAVQLKDVEDARKRILGFAHKTPALTSSTLDRMVSEKLGVEAHLVFKCENFQKVGAFKFRGATNSIKSLLAEYEGTGKKPVVITHSSGNHAQALALAAREQGVTCHVIMPNNAPSVKKAAVRGYGAIVTECEPTLQAREDTTAQVTDQLVAQDPNTVVEFISPYNDVRVIAGQGTLALEVLEQAEELGKPLDVLITPVGGGGMLSGCAVAAKGSKPTIRVIGAEPKGADDAYRSFYSKQFVPSVNPTTVADGLLTSLGSNTFPLILEHVDAIHTVSEEEIIRATKLVYERMKIVIEPSSAVPLAVALYSSEFMDWVKSIPAPSRLNIGIVFSGGNVDIVKLSTLFAQLETTTE
ncbi:hypothetical protein FRC04_011309 [Tulasnella sp. 424]|nr:hypothetical protein FRC04_011309 [Tulasnella sp. 424]KAG8975519.1 hypothetical protein FRC05_005588 [Tulasnella sp. 425]